MKEARRNNMVSWSWSAKYPKNLIYWIVLAVGCGDKRMVVWGKHWEGTLKFPVGLYVWLETNWSTFSKGGNGLCTALPESCTPQHCSPQTPKCCVCAKREDEHCTWTHLKEGLCPCIPRNLPQSIGFLDFHSVGFLNFRVKWVSRIRRKTAHLMFLSVQALCYLFYVTLSLLFIRTKVSFFLFFLSFLPSRRQ